MWNACLKFIKNKLKIHFWGARCEGKKCKRSGEMASGKILHSVFSASILDSSPHGSWDDTLWLFMEERGGKTPFKRPISKNRSDYPIKVEWINIYFVKF
jgi:hypothetical protein